MSDASDLRPIPSHPAYGASRDGRIWRLTEPPGALGPFARGSQSYPRGLKAFYVKHSKCVHIVKGMVVTVAQLVAQAWLPKPDCPRVVVFVNGDRDDCSADNLAWGSHRAVRKRRYRRAA